MGDFSVPPGDPGSLRSVSSSALSFGSTLGKRRSALARSGSKVSGALPRMRVDDFHGALSTSTKALDTVALSLGTVGGALSSYAEALDTAQTSIRAAKGAHERAEQQ